MAKKDNEIESEKNLDEQLELDKKDVSENSDSEEEMIREILSQNVTKLKKMAKEYKNWKFFLECQNLNL